MKILIVHNFYQYTGGEDSVLQSESALLKQHGHEILLFTKDNKEIIAYNFLQKAKFIQNTIYNRTIQAEFYSQIEKFKPDIVHVHNTFPLISPAIYDVCLEKKIPIIQTLHNFRLACPGALFYRENQVCEACLGKKIPWPGVISRCYRNSRIQSGIVALMIAYHNYIKTWQEKVDFYVALTEFTKSKFIQNGLPKRKIRVKPNFVQIYHQAIPHGENFAVFVGRISNEKGIQNLIQVWSSIKNYQLKIIGDGPIQQEIEALIRKYNVTNIELTGKLSHSQTLSEIGKAKFLILPSQCYENFPMTIVEAFACGTPVITSRLGAMQEIVQNGYTGLHFTPADPHDLAAKIIWAWTHPAEMAEMGKNARREYEEKYTPEKNYEMLMEIYQRAIEGKPK